MNVQATLAERGTRYGDFSDHALVAQRLQDVMRGIDIFAENNWTRGKLSDVQKQALTVIADKVARILSGDPSYADNWHDIQGYAKLVEDRLLNREEPVIELPALRAKISSIPRIGEYWPEEGGIYAGIMRGESGKPDYYLIAPNDAHIESIAWGGQGKEEPGAVSLFDGRANTAALCASKHKHPAAEWAAALTIEGHSDLYLPALRELRVLWANVPELFEAAWYWTSTQCSSFTAWYQRFGYGYQGNDDEGYMYRARAVRRREI